MCLKGGKEYAPRSFQPFERRTPSPFFCPGVCLTRFPKGDLLKEVSPGRVESGARHAFFYRGRWRVNPWITHPAYCVCSRCKKGRASDEWDRPVRVRIDRVSPFATEAESIRYAAQLRETEEARLRAEVDRARAEERAIAARVSFGEVCDAYRDYQFREGKRLDRDQYRLDILEDFFGCERDALSIDRREVERLRLWLTSERKVISATIERYLSTLIAALNGAVKEGLLESHRLHGLRRSRLPRSHRPRTFTRIQVQVLLGEAMNQFESEEARPRAGGPPHSVVPLRGFCLIAYRTLVRPSNNFGLRWEDLHLDPSGRSGRFKIERHKNAGLGLVLEGPLARGLVAYLGSMPEPSTGGLVHPNPATGKPFTSIRGSWRRLIAMANSVLWPEDQIAPDARFYTWRATGASELAATGADPVLVTKLMGDSSLRTVMRHYFDSSLDHMATALARWEAGSEGDGGLA